MYFKICPIPSCASSSYMYLHITNRQTPQHAHGCLEENIIPELLKPSPAVLLTLQERKK